MNENPYQPPNLTNSGVPKKPLKLQLHPLGLVIFGVAVFFIHALATKVPASKLRLLDASWLAATLAVVSISVVILSLVFARQCSRINARVELLYLLAPVCMLAYFGYRLVAG